MAEEEQVATTEPTAAAASEPTLTEKVAADEAGDAAKFAELKEKIEALGYVFVTIEELGARIKALEEAAPAAANEKLEALVAKMHAKMKMLIPMED